MYIDKIEIDDDSSSSPHKANRNHDDTEDDGNEDEQSFASNGKYLDISVEHIEIDDFTTDMTLAYRPPC